MSTLSSRPPSVQTLHLATLEYLAHSGVTSMLVTQRCFNALIVELNQYSLFPAPPGANTIRVLGLTIQTP